MTNVKALLAIAAAGSTIAVGGYYLLDAPQRDEDLAWLAENADALAQPDADAIPDLTGFADGVDPDMEYAEIPAEEIGGDSAWPMLDVAEILGEETVTDYVGDTLLLSELLVQSQLAQQDPLAALTDEVVEGVLPMLETPEDQNAAPEIEIGTVDEDEGALPAEIAEPSPAVANALPEEAVKTPRAAALPFIAAAALPTALPLSEVEPVDQLVADDPFTFVSADDLTDGAGPGIPSIPRAPTQRPSRPTNQFDFPSVPTIPGSLPVSRPGAPALPEPPTLASSGGNRDPEIKAKTTLDSITPVPLPAGILLLGGALLGLGGLRRLRGRA